MAKSKRSSTKKANNQRKVATIFGPAESARAERLSARLLELAKQPKPESSDVNMNEDAGGDEEAPAQDGDKAESDNAETAMDVDTSSKPSKARIGKKRIDKRRQKKAGIVFPKYSDRVGSKKKKGGK